MLDGRGYSTFHVLHDDKWLLHATGRSEHSCTVLVEGTHGTEPWRDTWEVGGEVLNLFCTQLPYSVDGSLCVQVHTCCIQVRFSLTYLGVVL